jgi:hypothetical protein
VVVAAAVAAAAAAATQVCNWCLSQFVISITSRQRPLRPSSTSTWCFQACYRHILTLCDVWTSTRTVILFLQYLIRSFRLHTISQITSPVREYSLNCRRVRSYRRYCLWLPTVSNTQLFTGRLLPFCSLCICSLLFCFVCVQESEPSKHTF